MNIEYEISFDENEVSNKCIDLYIKQDGICPVCGNVIEGELLIARIGDKPCCIHMDCLGDDILDGLLIFPEHFRKSIQESLESQHTYAEPVSSINELLELLKNV